MKIGERIEWVRQRMGVSFAEMGRRVGIPGQTLTNIVRTSQKRDDFEPDQSTLRRVAAAAGVSEVWLITGRGSPEGAPDSATATTAAVPRPTQATPSGPVAESPLEHALGAAFDHARHSVGDLRAVQDALSDPQVRWLDADEDLVEMAGLWLDAAAALRREGHPVTTVSILYRTTINRTRRARELGLPDPAAVAREKAQARWSEQPPPSPGLVEESGPSGVRVIAPAGSPTHARSAKG